MKKQIIIATVVVAGLTAYTLYNTQALTAQRENFLTNCQTNKGIYAEGVLTEKDWKCSGKDCATRDDARGMYVLQFKKHDLVKPTKATLPGVKKELDGPRRHLEKGKSYSVCMKQDFELIDYYRSF